MSELGRPLSPAGGAGPPPAPSPRPSHVLQRLFSESLEDGAQGKLAPGCVDTLGIPTASQRMGSIRSQQNGTGEHLLLSIDATGAHFPFCSRPSASSWPHCFPEPRACPRPVSCPLLSSTETIQRSIHPVSDCSFSPLCPAVLPHCHSDERAGSGSLMLQLLPLCLSVKV